MQSTCSISHILFEFIIAFCDECHRQDINQELDLHSNLLSDIDHNVDKTSSSLKTQTKKAQNLVAESGGCCGLCVILFLVGVIVMLVATNWACHAFNSSKC
jgi:hypothetical protein